MCDKIFLKNPQTKQKQYFMMVLKTKPCISIPIRYTQKHNTKFDVFWNLLNLKMRQNCD